MKLRAALVASLLLAPSTVFAQRGHTGGGGTIHSSIGTAPRAGTPAPGPAAPRTAPRGTTTATSAVGVTSPIRSGFTTSSPPPRHGSVSPFSRGSSFFGGYAWIALAYLPYGPGPDFGDDSTGGLRLEVEPRTGQVFVDGEYVGVVEDFNGRYDHLDLVPGPHRIEIRSTGYLPLAVDVLIQPRRTVVYRGSLAAAPQ
jgi:hypothetical protein